MYTNTPDVNVVDGWAKRVVADVGDEKNQDTIDAFIQLQTSKFMKRFGKLLPAEQHELLNTELAAALNRAGLSL